MLKLGSSARATTKGPPQPSSWRNKIMDILYGGKIKETDKGKGYPHLLHEPSSRKKSGLIFGQ